MARSAAAGHTVSSCLVYDNASAMPRAECAFTPGRDVWWQDAIPAQAKTCAVEWVPAEHPLFLLYTSGSTGESKVALLALFLALTTRVLPAGLLPPLPPRPPPRTPPAAPFHTRRIKSPVRS